MINALTLKSIPSPDNARLSRYYQCMFRRLFHRLLCGNTLLRGMKNYPLFDTFEYNLYDTLFLQSKKQIHDCRIERYQLYLYDKKRNITFKCILMIKKDGTLWVDVVNIRNKYARSNCVFRAESHHPKVLYTELVKTLLTWN